MRKSVRLLNSSDKRPSMTSFREPRRPKKRLTKLGRPELWLSREKVRRSTPNLGRPSCSEEKSSSLFGRRPKRNPRSSAKLKSLETHSSRERERRLRQSWILLSDSDKRPSTEGSKPPERSPLSWTWPKREDKRGISKGRAVYRSQSGKLVLGAKSAKPSSKRPLKELRAI